jgi:lipopolysaccharide assembly protein A
MSWRLALLVPLAVLLVLFALSNWQIVALTLWPFDLAWEVPLSIAVLIIAALAFLLGAGVAWISSLPYRRQARRMEQTARLLQAELDDTKARLAREAGATVLPPPATR